MATIYRQEPIKKLIDSLRLAPARDNIPNQIADKILPVTSIDNSYNIQLKSTSALNTASAVIHTTRTDADTYLIGANFSLIKDATSTSTVSTMQIVPYDSAATVLLNIVGLTLTIQNDSISQSFNIPIKLARGSTISLTNGTAVANITCRGTVMFYEVPD